MSTEKRCVDCKHCRWPAVFTGSSELIEWAATCHHPKNEGRMSPVIGEATALLCHVTRTTDRCGPNADWFEPHGGEPGI